MKNRSRRRRVGGFSLIELMVVITIIGILGAFVGANVWTAMRDAEIQTTKTQMLAIEDAIKRFKLGKRRLPESLEELVPDYLDAEELPQDAWGNDFLYTVEGRNDFSLVSLGEDGVEGGEENAADIARSMLRKRSGDDDE